MVDVLGLPQRLEQGVAEAQGGEVLHRLLAQVMVDAESLALAEGAAYRVVDGGGGGEAAAHRLLDHHPRLAGVEADFGEAAADRREQVRRGGEVEHPHPLAAFAQGGGEFAPAGVLGGVERAVVEHRQEALDQGRQARLVIQVFDEGRPHLVAVVLGGDRLAGHAGDARAGLDLRIGMAAEQGRQQLAQSQVAGAAEDDQIEGIHRFDRRAHFAPRCALEGSNNTNKIPHCLNLADFRLDSGQY